jgi:hypothetical protein
MELLQLKHHGQTRFFFLQPPSNGHSKNGQNFSVATENNLKMGIFSVTQ